MLQTNQSIFNNTITNLPPFIHDSTLQSLQHLIKILEDLFFSLNIPEEVVHKYNILKETTFIDLQLPFELITPQRYPNLKMNETIQTKHASFEIFTSMLRLGVEILHYQDYLYTDRDIHMKDLQRMVDNIEKLFSFLPYDEVETLKIASAYLIEFRSFIRERNDIKIKAHIEYLEGELQKAKNDFQNVIGEKEILQQSIQEMYSKFDDQLEMLKNKHRSEIENLQKTISELLQENKNKRELNYTPPQQDKNNFEDNQEIYVYNQNMEYISAKLKQVYEDNINNHKNYPEVSQQNEDIKHLDFVLYLINLYKVDNQWLLDKLGDLNQENQKLQSTLCNTSNLNSLNMSKSLERSSGKYQTNQSGSNMRRQSNRRQ